jgi:Tol biopolymer transport system component
MQLTFSGDNAEAYFNPSGDKLTLQISNPEKGIACDQIFMIDLNQIQKGQAPKLEPISNGFGRTTCSYFMPDGKHILYASTAGESQKACPPPPKPIDGRYLWGIHPEYDIYISDLKGNITKQLTNSPGYDAEAVVSPDGKKILFTSIRSGDLELWIMDIDGSNLKQLTFDLGYDGGGFFSSDSRKIVFRASRPEGVENILEYKSLLKQGLVAPTQMEIYTINTDGTNLKKITSLGKANWSPYFHPKGDKILFSSNHHASKGYEFQIFSIDTNGHNLEQITYQSNFNAFPMFSPNGKKLVFSSNRNPEKPRETNVYIADWVDVDPNEHLDTNLIRKHIQYLASDERAGRLAGSHQELQAAQYIDSQLKSYQLLSKIIPFTYKYRVNPHDDKHSEEIKARNIIGYLDNNAKRTIVIGAHYDHIGRNEHKQSTLPNSDGQIHNGADDNASGVAAVLELARILSQNNEKEPVNFVFAFFSGEEDGLMGSKAIAKTIHQDYPKPLVMINMDMVGRLNSENLLNIGGIGSSPMLPQIVARSKPAHLKLALDSSGVGPSDHTSFYQQNIPVLFAFTGTHADYHKPSDDEDKINYQGLSSIARFVHNLTIQISLQDSLPFTKTSLKEAKSVPKYKVTMGIMPSYGDSDHGMLIDGVTQGKAADKAGILSGDILTRIGDCKIKEVYSYMDCLSKIKEGETHTVELIRKNENLKLKVTF